MKVLAIIVSTVIMICAFLLCLLFTTIAIEEGIDLPTSIAILVTVITGVFFIMILRVLYGKMKFPKKFCIVLVAIIIMCIAGVVKRIKDIEYESSVPELAETQLDLQLYTPFQNHVKLARLNTKSTLLIKDNFPKLDGATSFFPVYSAFVEAAYDKEAFTTQNHTYASSYPDEIRGKVLECTRTEKAYEKIINRQTDIAFVLAPSDEQLKLAEERNAKLKFIPIGKEAFVFFVNSQNEVKNLTVSEIKDIYSGEVKNWRDVGGKWEKIQAFQRNKNSGSQTALENLMQGRTIIEADHKVGLMGAMLDEVANYKNYNSAIGFSFRYFATEMEKNNDIKLLEVDGVYPTLETMENGTYPLTNEFYAVIREDNKNENVDKFINWILSEEGQELVRKSGYAGI
jgi:phosphate transport system substrate-binding protein